jgi:hypothetical protein
MRLFRGKIAVISAEVARTLSEEGDIDTDNLPEVEQDVEAVLKEYLRTDQEIVEKAKDLLEIRKLPYSQFSRIKKTIADTRGFGIGEDSLDYIIQQIIGSFMHSIHVQEVYTEDHDLRRKIRPILRKHMSVDEEVEQEVRDKIKNLQEGSSSWEVEYQRVKEQILRKRRLSE